MSYSGSNAHELTARLLAALDSSYDVVDMHAVNEIISVLEKIHITKDLLETTRLGRHVNLLRRRTRDPSLARRAKVLVKRWRDLVIPGSVQQRPSGHGHGSRTSAERHARPLTSPAVSRVVSPAVASPASSSRPGWSGYDSDSQDVILVDDDPPPPPPPPPTAAPPLAPERSPPAAPPPADVRRAKRDKKPKKKRGHSRAGSESVAAEVGVGVGVGAGAAEAWGARNGASPPAAAAAPPVYPAPPARRNGCRKPQLDAYSTLIHKMPPAGSKKVKTTQELLEAIQSRGPALSPLATSFASTANSAPSSPDVQLIESPEPPVEVCGVPSPLRNGGESPRASASPSPSPRPPTPPPPPDEEPYPECTCGEDAEEEGGEGGSCPAARRLVPEPLHVHALHNAQVAGVNGTRAPPAPHPHAVRAPVAPDAPGLFASVVPLYRYLDYADDYCSKNFSRVDLCPWLRIDEFAPSPPPPPAPPTPPPPRPYPLAASPLRDLPKAEPHSEDEEMEEVEARDRIEGFDVEDNDVSMKSEEAPRGVDESKILDSEINFKPVSLGTNSPAERLKPPDEEKTERAEVAEEAEAAEEAETAASEVDEEPPQHRTVERAKVEIDGRSLYACCERARAAAAWSYAGAARAPLVPLAAAADARALADALAAAAAATERDALGRPVRDAHFAEWHEAARLSSDLVALPYVVID